MLERLRASYKTIHRGDLAHPFGIWHGVLRVSRPGQRGGVVWECDHAHTRATATPGSAELCAIRELERRSGAPAPPAAEEG